MKKLLNIFYCNVALLGLFLILVGCGDDTKKESPTAPSENSLSSESKSSTKSNDSSNLAIADNTPPQNKESEKKESATKSGTDRDSSDEDIDMDKNDVQNKIDDLKLQSENQHSQIQTDTDKKDQEKAISLVKDYLRDQGELIEDEDHFVGYDGEFNGFIIVRYSTLVSGHSSTNGRYAVDLKSGKIVDVTVNLEFFTQ